MAKTLDLNKMAGTFTFNANYDASNRIVIPTGEKFTSVFFAPEGATGEWAMPADGYAYSAAYLNAMGDYAFGGYILKADTHQYSNHNPDRVGGSWGWVRIENAPANGSKELYSDIVLDGKKRSVRWPMRRIAVPNKFDKDGQPAMEERVYIEPGQEWLPADEIASANGFGTLILKNSQLDTEFSGTRKGNELHKALALLENGTSLKVTVIIKPWIGHFNPDGSQIWSHGLQDKAIYLHGVNEIAKTSIEEAKRVYWLDKVSKKSWGEMAPAVEGFRKENPVTAETSVKIAANIVPVIEGGKMAEKAASTLKSGFYRAYVYANGKQTNTVIPGGWLIDAKIRNMADIADANRHAELDKVADDGSAKFSKVIFVEIAKA